MDYHFKILQAKGLNYNKYELGSYDYLQTITPTSNWGLRKERDADFWPVVRITFNGKVTVTGLDFTFLQTLEGTDEQLALIIEQKRAGVWTELWKGFFTWHDFDVDMDRCTISFTPSPWDNYTPIFDQFELEQNVLQVEDTYDLVATFPSYDTEDYYESYQIWSYAAITPITWVKITGEYALYRRDTQYYINPNDYSDYWWWVADVYRREVTYASTGITPPGPDWVDLAEEVSPGVWKWARPVYDSSLGTASYTNTNHGLDDTWILDGSGDTFTWEFFRCRKLTDVIEFFCLLYGKTFASDLFSATNPVSAWAHRLDWAFIQQISEVGMHQDAATRGLLTFRDLLTWIRDTWDAYWYIDPNGDLRIEHELYFLNGESYTVPKTVGLDLTAVYTDQVKHMNRYSYEKASLYRFEQWSFPLSGSFDWLIGPIRYPQQSLLEDKTLKRTPGWATDVLYLYEERKGLTKDGWVLLLGDYYSGIWAVLTGLGNMTSTAMPNADLSPGVELMRYWKENRLFLTAEWDSLGISLVFNSTLRMKIQDDLIIPDCFMAIDFNQLVKTEMGTGLIQTGEWDAKTGNIKIQIKYA